MPVVFCGKAYRRFIFSWNVLNPELNVGLKYSLNIHLQNYCTINFTGFSKKGIIQNVCKNFPELKEVAVQVYNKKFKNNIGMGITGTYSDSKGIEIIDDDLPF